MDADGYDDCGEDTDDLRSAGTIIVLVDENSSSTMLSPHRDGCESSADAAQGSHPGVDDDKSTDETLPGRPLTPRTAQQRRRDRRRSREETSKLLADPPQVEQMQAFAGPHRTDACYYFSEEGDECDVASLDSSGSRSMERTPSLFAQALLRSTSPPQNEDLEDSEEEDEDEDDDDGFITSVPVNRQDGYDMGDQEVPDSASNQTSKVRQWTQFAHGSDGLERGAPSDPAPPPPLASDARKKQRLSTGTVRQPSPMSSHRDARLFVSADAVATEPPPSRPSLSRHRTPDRTRTESPSSDVYSNSCYSTRTSEDTGPLVRPNRARTMPAQPSVLDPGFDVAPPPGDTSPDSVAAAAKAAPTELQEDWNMEFQAALDLPEGSEKWNRLSQLARDFVYCSKTYGKIIISEYYLPDKQMTIKPLRSPDAGQAGGRKYLCSRIFFKFALDTRLLTTDENGNKTMSDKWMYGGSSGPDDYAAMKAAKNEILGLLSFYNTNTKGLHYPLMSVIDYRGFRLIALSILPISKRTLVYGSSDGGRTVHADIAQLNQKMKEVARNLNIKGHRVGHREVMLHSPGDIEGHLGTDGKFYVIDYGRVFPPEAPTKKGREVFYNLLRPEFVRCYPTPLSSDAFTGFGYHHNKIHNTEVRGATMHLYDTVIPEFAASKELQELVNIDYFSDEFRLTERLHSSGINCRHLGRVRAALPEKATTLRDLLLTEMAARTLTAIMRQLLREEMKKTTIAAREEPYKKLSLKVFNACLGAALDGNESQRGSGAWRRFSSPVREAHPVKMTSSSTLQTRETSQLTPEKMASLEFWTVSLKLLLEKKFPQALTEAEQDESFNLRDSLDVVYLMHRICQQTGVHWSQQAFKEFRAAPQEFRLMKFDLQKISARVKHLNVIDEAEGNLLFYEATKGKQGNIRSGLWKATNEKFARAVASNTSNPVTFVRWGRILIEQFNRMKLEEDAVPYLSLARQLLSAASEKFTEARKLNNDLWESHSMLGTCCVNEIVLLTLFSSLDSIANIKWLYAEAAAHFERAFFLNPHCYNMLVEEAKHDYDAAEQLTQAQFTVMDQSKIRNRIHVLYMKAYSRLACVLQAAPFKPDAYTFFLAGMCLYKFLVHGGANPGLHVSGMAALMFESALLINPCASDASFMYTLPDPVNFAGQASKLRSVGDDCIDCTVSVTPRLEDASAGPAVSTTLTVPLANQLRLYMYPIATSDPRGSYNGTLVINTMFHLLGQNKSSSGPVQRIKQEFSTISLGCSVYDDFVLSSVEIGLPPSTDPSRPEKIILYGSQFLPAQFSDSFEADALSPGHLGERFLIASMSVQGREEVSIRMSITQRQPARYLVLRLLPSSAGQRTIGLTSLAFYGNLVPHSTAEDKEASASPASEYNPPIVCWANQADLSQRIQLTRVRVSNKVKKISSIFHWNQPAVVQANTPFTVNWSSDDTLAASNRSNRATVLWVERSGAGSIVNQQILKLAKRAFSGKLKVVHMKDAKAAMEWCKAQSNRAVHKLVKYRQFRIVTDIECALQDVGSIGSGSSTDGVNRPHCPFAQWLFSQKQWSDVPLLVFCRILDVKDPSLLPHSENLYVSSQLQTVIDFMATAVPVDGSLMASGRPELRRARNCSTDSSRMDEASRMGHLVQAGRGAHSLSQSVGVVESLEASRPSKSGSVLTSPLSMAARAIREATALSIEKKATSSPEMSDLRLSGNHMSSPFLYFEVSLEKVDKHGVVAIGVTSSDFPLQGQMPGWHSGSYALHSDDGYLHCGSAAVKYKFSNRQLHPFSTGDIIGCGYSLATKQLFWTRNGTLLGSAEKGMSRLTTVARSYVYPSVGFDRNTQVRANFGDSPFAFDPTPMLFSAPRMDGGHDTQLASPFPELFEQCVDHQGLYLIELCKIAGSAPTLQALLRAHFTHRAGEVSFVSTKEQRDATSAVYSVIDISRTGITDAALVSVCRMFPALSQLNISHCASLTDASLQVLAEQCERPEMLDLSGNEQFSLETSRTLAKHYESLKALRVWESIPERALVHHVSELAQLRALDLKACTHLSDSAVRAIMARVQLISLNISNCEKLTDRSLLYIGKSQSASTLQKLGLACCKQLTERALVRVVKACVSLQAISVAGNSMVPMDVSDTFVNELCAHRRDTLEAINLYRCTRVTSAAVTTLGRSCAGLTEVDIGHCSELSDSAIAALAQGGTCLRNLELFNTAVCDDTAKLFAIRHTNLQALSLQRCRCISAEGCIALVPELHSAKFLSLKELGLTDELIDFIADCNEVENLRTLDISRSTASLSGASINRLMRKKPKLRVVHNQVDSFTTMGRWNLTRHSVSSLRTRKNSL